MKRVSFYQIAILTAFTFLMFSCKDAETRNDTAPNQYDTESGMSGDANDMSPGSNLDNTTGTGMHGDTLTTGGTGTGGSQTGTGTDGM